MKLYRFQSINKLTLQNLNNIVNWVADPLEFNDPFEFSLHDEVLEDGNGDFRLLNIEEQANVIKFKDSINEYGVICYSSDCFNNLLWAHYAENHKGMCLVFDIKKEKEKDLLKVNYQENFPEINLRDDADTHAEILKIVTTKSIEWNYENEYRQVFLFKNMPYQYPGKLAEIIFGCRTPFDDIKMVTNIALNNDKNIIISKMFKSMSTYTLQKTSLGDNTKLPNIFKHNDIRV